MKWPVSPSQTGLLVWKFPAIQVRTGCTCKVTHLHGVATTLTFLPLHTNHSGKLYVDIPNRVSCCFNFNLFMLSLNRANWCIGTWWPACLARWPLQITLHRSPPERLRHPEHRVPLAENSGIFKIFIPNQNNTRFWSSAMLCWAMVHAANGDGEISSNGDPRKRPFRNTGTSQIVSELGTTRFHPDVSEEIDQIKTWKKIFTVILWSYTIINFTSGHLSVSMPV